MKAIFSMFLIASVFAGCAGGDNGDYDIIEEDTVTSRKYSPSKEEAEPERDK